MGLNCTVLQSDVGICEWGALYKERNSINFVVGKSFYRALSAGMKRMPVAQAAGGLMLLPFAIYAGYMVPPSGIPKALRWGQWLNPLRCVYMDSAPGLS